MAAACLACGGARPEFLCGRCRRARFCGAECQRAAWRRHRPACRAGEAPAPAVAGGRLAGPLCLEVYPNVGSRQGGVEVRLEEGADLAAAYAAAAGAALGVGPAATGSDARLFALPEGAARAALPGGADEAESAAEVTSLEALVRVAAGGGALVAAAPRTALRACAAPGDGAESPAPDGDDARRGRQRAAAARPRYDRALVGGEVARLEARSPDLAAMLRCPVPVVIAGSDLTERATGQWSFEYLQKHMDDVDNFFVLRAPAESDGRFAYYDMKPEKNPCGHHVTPTNERIEMRFHKFRQQAAEASRLRRGGAPAPSYYLQNTVLHRDEEQTGPPKPVGSFGVSCGCQVGADIASFRWDWLKDAMGGRCPQMCQLFCGHEGGFSPCHYDPQDNVFAQIRGYKRVLLFHPKHFRSLYPWPVHHPQDRQSRVDFDLPDLETFPRFAELRGQGLEAVLGPGDALHIPPGWWHHIEMLPSPPNGEVVSINFWYTAPRWFYGDARLGEAHIKWDRPLQGARRVLFQRCVEELVAHSAGAAAVPTVVRVAMGGVADPAELGLGPSECQAVADVRTFVSAVFPDDGERRDLLAEVIEGRFAGLALGPPARAATPAAATAGIDR